MQPKNHFTTRRAFIAAGGFGGISLYGLWAAYGAAPGPLALLGLDHPQELVHGEGEGEGEGAAELGEQSATQGAHAGHGAAAQGPSPEEFSRMTAEFAERFRMPDGSVYPRRVTSSNPTPTEDPHAGHTMPAGTSADHDMPTEPDPHVGHGSAPVAATETTNPHAAHGDSALPNGSEQAIDVLMTAGRWYYLPNVLRLDAGQAYRFKMMAVDIAHGASIQLGKGGRMMRLQPGRITETALTFQRPGRYLMVCTVYCGEAHGLMQATIEVV